MTGARHVLKLVDGSLGNVPVRFVPNADGTLGGFTVGVRESRLHSGRLQQQRRGPDLADSCGCEPPHSAAAVIADTVTLLSNQWQDAA